MSDPAPWENGAPQAPIGVESRRRFGTTGIPTGYTNHGHRTHLVAGRYRKQLDRLNDRQLAKRYARYLRWVDQVYLDYDTTKRWPAIGSFAQASRRLWIAHQLLKERGLHVPEREEVWARPARREVCNENLEIYDALGAMTDAELEETLEASEAHMERDRTSVVHSERIWLVWGQIDARRRAREARDSGTLLEVSPQQARILRQRVVEQMTQHIGYPWTPTEADKVLRGLGIVTRTPETAHA